MRREVLVIAEAGVNHNGEPDLARQLIDAAAEAGADAVKFQSFQADQLVSRFAQKADYQKQTTDADESQLEMIRKLELDEAAHRMLQAHCRDRGILFLSSPFDLPSVDFLARLGLPVFKIPSGQITDLPYLRRIGALGKEVILSTGMSQMDEIRAALDVLVASGTAMGDMVVLHANTDYPTAFHDVNLRAMQTIGAELGVAVGYSDHTPGIEIPVAAVAMGARVVEKHFTLSRGMEGPDHRASLEPSELMDMVRAIRHVEAALGDGVKRPSDSESRNTEVARKSIVAAGDIAAGDIFTVENITTKRPATGVSPMCWDAVVGTVATRAYRRDEPIDA